METDFGALSTAEKRLWAAEAWQAGRDENYFYRNGFVAKGQNTPVSLVTELTETERGAECVLQLVLDMQNDGTVGDNKLEDNEEQLINDAQIIRIDQLRHGAVSKGEMSEQKTVIRFRAQAKEKLKFWMADKLDELMFLATAGRAFSLKTDGSTRTNSQLPSLSFGADVAAASTNRIMYAGSATSEATLTSTDKMSWATILRAKTMAKRKKLRPIREGGKEYFVLLMSGEQERDVCNDPTYQAIVKAAGERGHKNPLFTNAMAVVSGIVLHSHNKVFNTLGLSSGSKWGSGSTVDGAQAQLLGAQALGLATIGNAFMRERDTTDYGNRPGIGFGRKVGIKKPQFKSLPDGGTREDFGTITVKTAAAA